MNALTITGARKRFGPTTALDGASFELRQGELLAFLGPNGAGKTTLIRAIAGRVRLDAGEIRLFDRMLDGRGTPPELGIVPQEVAVYGLLTARENLAIFGRLLGLSGADLDRQVAWALDRTGLADRAGEIVKRFSGGMKRRLNIACGLLHQPRVLLLDEPTVGVDPQSRSRICDVLGELAATGAADVQRLGAGRVSEGLLAQRAGLAALAAGRGAGRRVCGVHDARAVVRAQVGIRLSDATTSNHRFPRQAISCQEVRECHPPGRRGLAGGMWQRKIGS